jgi:hypothetical protein
MTPTKLLYTCAPVAVCEAARSLPNPPTGDGADVSSWSGQDGATEQVELTIHAGGAVTLTDAALVAEETADTFPEETAAVTVTNATDTINYTAHGFYTGDGPVRLGGTAVPAGSSADAEYYVVRTGANTFKLATTRVNALAGTVVNLTDDGTAVAVFWVTGIKSTSQNASAIDATANTYTIAAHGIETGTRVQVANTGGAVPTGLAANTDYYAISIDENTLAFATTVENAEAGTAIDWSAGSGTQSVISDNRGPTEATVYVLVDWLNNGDAIDLTQVKSYRERFPHNPDAVAYHLVSAQDAPVPITSYARGVTTLY